MKVQCNLKIFGTVQGVFYRANAKERAEELKVTGWVKNNMDGTVQICVQGDQSKVNDMISWCYEGPPGSIVDDIKIERKALRTEDELEGFEIKY